MTAVLRSTRLKKLLLLAEANERRLAQQLAAANREVEDAHARSQDLQGYRASQPIARLRNSRPAPAFADARRFFEKLTVAIKQQKSEVNGAQVRHSLASAAWAEARLRVMRFERLIEKADRQQQQHDNRSEQKIFDEQAQRRFRSSR